MDILQPELIWVDGRCYRVYENVKRVQDACNLSPYVEDDDQTACNDSEEEYDSGIDIVPHGSRYKHTFSVARSIIGAKGAVHKKLEAETKTQIKIPKIGEDGDIVIIGSDHRAIKKARTRINLIIETARKRLPKTHFVSIPLNEGQIIMNFNMFKNDVLSDPAKIPKGVDEMIFQKPSKLHLTIGVLTLLDAAEINKAVEALDFCKKHIVKPAIEKYGEIPIRLKGTEIMNDDPSEARVLYAEVEDQNEILQNIADEILYHYDSIGLLEQREKKVKLHVTLMKTSYKLSNENLKKDGNGSPTKTKLTFDARDILEAHKDTIFGETTVKQIHLSQRHTISSNGYYQATAKINVHDGF
ncbi:activating signal cointegrator 1 complex subunit 1 isoform X2 [Ceratina calcarata]|uniref:Activating signal cointegrator 1 complex subunit 1 isoform X2 n=1 Tax=Ceratina calcarata TaxID=156304 RepID=A0AAJ7WAN6_9HYME|nr:activating signal cointegrator 1 complex subunit 1 isoform X2 [Ceratina calcarata]